MESRFLKSLIAVIDSGSIAEAARMEHLTAAAISQRIKSLELEFGVELLCRSGQTVKATEACKKILARARYIVKEVKLMSVDLKKDDSVRTLRLGVIPSQLSPKFVSTLDILRLYCPSTRVSLAQNTSGSLYSSLLSGEIDGAILEKPEFELPNNFDSHFLRREALVLISKKPVKGSVRETLESNSYIEYLPEPFVVNAAQKYLEENNISLRSSCDTCSLQAIKILVTEGVGVSLVPKWQGLENCGDEFVVTELGDEYFAREIVLITSNVSNCKDVFDALLGILRP